MNKIPRPEHPNPLFERDCWVNLNGEWEFEIDNSDSGEARKIYKDSLRGKIIVPFCPESKLSGIHNTDFMNSVWYRKKFTVTKEQTEKNILLHFGAVDYKATVYVNSVKVKSHIGGYSPFCIDITEHVKEGENYIAVHAEDNIRSRKQPRGKQSSEYYSHDCDYTRTTGIWQTVWIEFVPETHIKSLKYYPDCQNGTLTVMAETTGTEQFEARAFFDGRPVGTAKLQSPGKSFCAVIKLTEKHLWELGKGNLYTLEISYGEDKIHSYFGLRNIGFDGVRFMLNGKSVFQRLVLDQGFYPDGIYTAASEEAMINDIKISMALGFNGARLHQKVFEPRFLYHCDRMGYMVWGEHASWGIDHTEIGSIHAFLSEWTEVIQRDFNHPAIVCWCPFNETWDIDRKKQCDLLIADVYKITKLLDSTRPCIDTSGNFHVITDIYDIHDYQQDTKVFADTYKRFEKDDTLCYELENMEVTKNRQHYGGEPLMVSEYGGIKWDEEQSGESWGYGKGPENKEEFIQRYKELTETLLKNKKICGFCYTQLYDVEQEKNGLYTYERKPKFDADIFKSINSQKAKIED